MPAKAKAICRAPGCSITISAPGYCGRHEQHNHGWKHTQERKGNTTERGYGHAWRKVRNGVLQRDDFLCQPCKRKGHVTAATEVDHIIPKADGGSDDESNLEAICRTCHKSKTQKEGGGRKSAGLHR